jgi:hypothetical protein
MTLEQLILSAAAALGDPGFQYTRDKTCDMVLANGLHLVIEPSRTEEAVHLYAVVGNLPAFDREVFAETLLRAQLFHREMGEGCCFGLDDDTDEILLNRKLSIQNLGEESFLSVLNEFANWASYWRDKLQAPPVATPSSSASLDDFQMLRA